MSSNYCKILLIIVVLLSTLTLSSHGIPSEIGSISALYAEMNGRKTMEDFAVRIENVAENGFYAILDGHQGNYSADFAKKYLTKSFRDVIQLHHGQSEEGPKSELDFENTLIYFTDEMEAHLIEAARHGYHKSGTTCLMVVVEKNKLTVGNVGDSRGVMCNFEGQAIELSVDHKAGQNENEEKRMIAADESISEREGERIYKLAMTRSLGDFGIKKKAKKDVIISKPEIQTFNLSEHRPKFMILASDGLWDKVDSKMAVDYINARYLTDDDFGAKALAKKAIKLGSRDNITVMVVVFKNRNPAVATTSRTVKIGLKSFSKKLSDLFQGLKD